MREFVYGTDQQYELLKESLNDHMCHVYGHCIFPSCFSKNAGRIGFEKEGDTYALFIDKGITCSKGNTSQLFRDWLSAGTLRFLDFTDMKVYLLSMMPDNTVKSALKQCLSSAENTFRSILITASSFLTMFNQNPKLAAMLSHSTFTLQDLINPKTALFLVTDDTTSTADPILGIIISQIQTFLVAKAYRNKNGRLNVRMNFVLDEFASIPIPNMDKSLATHRSRNIRYYLCVQSLALLKERYENPEKLLSNCASTLYLGSTELELLKELEAKLGTTCITPDGKEKPLCSQSELMTLERSWSHKEAIYMNLAEGIRYCTMLPSIEAYNIGNHPLPTYAAKLPAIETYTVKEFATDVVNERIRAPFAPVQKKKTTSREKSNKHAHSSSDDDSSDTDLEAELMKKFDELFGSCDDD